MLRPAAASAASTTRLSDEALKPQATTTIRCKLQPNPSQQIEFLCGRQKRITPGLSSAACCHSTLDKEVKAQLEIDVRFRCSIG